MPPDARLGQRIRQARLDAGLSLARAGGGRLSPGFLCLIEHGRRGVPADRLIYLAERLGTGVGYFLAGGTHAKYVEALLRGAESLLDSGEHSRAAAVFGDLLPHVPHDRTDLAARCRTGLGLALVRLRQYGLAAPHLAEGGRLAGATGDPRLIAQAHRAIAVSHIEQNEYQQALPELETALAHLRRHRCPDPALLSMILMNLGQSHRWLNRRQEALGYLDEAAQVAEATGNRVLRGMIARVTAGVFISLKVYAEARAHLEAALAHFTAAERLDMVAFVENGLGTLCLDTGEVRQAIPHFQRAASLCARIPDDKRCGRNLTELGRAHILLGRHDTALPYVQEAIRLAMKVNDDVEAARAEALRGEILCARDRLREAEAAFTFAIPIFERREQHKELVQAYAWLGKVLQAQGRVDQASVTLAHAVALARAPAR